MLTILFYYLPPGMVSRSCFNIIEKAAVAIEMSFKTVCMVANPFDRSRIVSECFPQLTLANCKLRYVSHFKYLGHIIENTFWDDSDVNRELKNLYAKVNVLIRRFSYCSTQANLRLFKSYCLLL